MNKSTKIVIVVVCFFVLVFFLLMLLYKPTKKQLVTSITGKLCCQEIGGTVSGSNCNFKDLDGTDLTVKLNEIENHNGKNYCTDAYFDRK